VTDQELRSLHRKEWMMTTASALLIAVFFVVGLNGF